MTKTSLKTITKPSAKTSAKAKMRPSGAVIVRQEMNKVIKKVKSEEKAKNSYLSVYF